MVVQLDKPADDTEQKESLKKQVSHILEEARMVLPGIQAMLGFQFVAVFNNAFSTKLTHTEQYIHLAAILLSVLSITMLMAPAAIHRRCEPGSISKQFASLSSKLISFGMVPLMLSIAAECYVVSRVVTDNSGVSLSISIAVLLMIMSLWFLFPSVHGWNQEKHER